MNTGQAILSAEWRVEIWESSAGRVREHSLASGIKEHAAYGKEDL